MKAVNDLPCSHQTLINYIHEMFLFHIPPVPVHMTTGEVVSTNEDNLARDSLSECQSPGRDHRTSSLKPGTRVL